MRIYTDTDGTEVAELFQLQPKGGRQFGDSSGYKFFFRTIEEAAAAQYPVEPLLRESGYEILPRTVRTKVLPKRFLQQPSA